MAARTNWGPDSPAVPADTASPLPVDAEPEPRGGPVGRPGLEEAAALIVDEAVRPHPDGAAALLDRMPEPDPATFDMTALGLPDDLTGPPEDSTRISLRERAWRLLTDSPASRFLIPVAIGAGVIAGLRVSTVLWQISPFALLVPTLIGLVFWIRRYRRRSKVTSWYYPLRAAATERDLLTDAIWVGPAAALAGPDDAEHAPWDGLLAAYPDGVAWFPASTVTASAAAWWKRDFTDIALVHRSGGSDGVGLDIHLHGGQVKCQQIPAWWADGVVEALSAVGYPVLDD